MKRQKVKFHRNDKRPGGLNTSLSYHKKMIKKNNKIYWQAVEKPTGKIIKQSFFEEDVDKLVNFQNKHKQWQLTGGIPLFLCDNINNINITN